MKIRQYSPPCGRHVSTVARLGPVIAVTGLAFEASIAAGLGVTVLRGDDRRMLRAGLQRAVARGGRGIISFGVAGGLEPGLMPGECVVAAAVVTANARYATCAHWSPPSSGRAAESAQGSDFGCRQGGGLSRAQAHLAEGHRGDGRRHGIPRCGRCRRPAWPAVRGDPDHRRSGAPAAAAGRAAAAAVPMERPTSPPSCARSLASRASSWR